MPVALEPEADDSTELMEAVEMAVPAVPVEGAVAVIAGEATATTVSFIPEPQVEATATLLASEGEDKYHQ